MSRPWERPTSFSRTAVAEGDVVAEAIRLREPVPQYASERYDELAADLIERRSAARYAMGAVTHSVARSDAAAEAVADAMGGAA